MTRLGLSIFAGALSLVAVSHSAGASGIYYTDTSADTINRIGLDGSNPTVLVSGFGTNLNGITATANDLFWTDISADAVFSSGIDGSNPGVFLDVSVQSGTIFLTDITDDGENVYFSDGGFEERLYSSPINSPSLNQIGSNIDIDEIEADPNAGALYYSDFNEIFRSNLDGSDFGPILGGRSGIRALTVDPGSNTLYWLEDGTVFSAAGDGSDVQSVLDLATVPDYGFAIATDAAFFDGTLYWIEAGDNDGIWSLDIDDPSAGPTQLLAQTNIGNLDVIPSPGTFALLACAGICSTRRRRHS
jgi:hypothetical protein